MHFLQANDSNENWEACALNNLAHAELLTRLVDSANVGIAILDRDFRYVYTNRSLAQMNNVPMEAHLGRTVNDILGEVAAKIEIPFRHVLATKQSLPNFELVAHLPAKVQPGRWIENYFPIEDSQGAVRWVGVIVVERPNVHAAQPHPPVLEVPEQSSRWQLLLRFSAILASVTEEEELFAMISECVRSATAADFASLALYDDGVRGLRVHVLNSALEGEFPEVEEMMPASDLGYERTFLHGEFRILNRDDLLATNAPSLRRLRERGVQSLCLIPLVSNRGVLGTLNLASRKENAFAAEVKLLEHVAAQVAIALENALARREIVRLNERLRQEKLYLRDEIHASHNFDEIIGDSPALKRVLRNVQTVAPNDATVLILGETGTGKELIARAIHRLSGRADGSFIKLNCAAIPTGLLESELFGHEKGAFTGAITQKIGRLELADKGTLFLDEVGEIPLELQPKLLRVLQDQEFERLGGTRTIKVDIRLIAATNRDLAARVAQHEFRSDLYYRLHVFPIRVPTLRERSRDISLLVRYFVQKFSKRLNKRIETIPAEAMRALETWQWPGNVRELENFIERSVILSEGSSLNVPLAELNSGNETGRHGATLEDMEREQILRVLRETGGVIAGVHGAAARLGMKRTTLQSRIQRLGITRTEFEN